MEKNVGKIDKIVRYVLGVILIVISFLTPPLWWLAILGVVSIATAALGRCGLYKLIGINTCKLKTPKK